MAPLAPWPRPFHHANHMQEAVGGDAALPCPAITMLPCLAPPCCSSFVIRHLPVAGGRSESVKLDAASHEWGAWCVEVMEALGLLKEGAAPPLHMGVSLGGEAG